MRLNKSTIDALPVPVPPATRTQAFHRDDVRLGFEDSLGSTALVDITKDTVERRRDRRLNRRRRGAAAPTHATD
jgi:hypothetical protein